VSDQDLYRTTATVQGGREGHAATDDGHLSVNLSVPKSLGGSGGEGTNPEQLFAAGYAACFQSALSMVGRRERVDTSKSTIEATVGLRSNGSGGYVLTAALAVSLPGVDAATGQRLLEAAHQVCPYSSALRGNVEVQLSIVDA
jgi:Ohr subfamily peroxiredoxin